MKDILIEELENKKTFTAMYSGSCDNCGYQFIEGDDFVFMGSKRKVCDACLRQLIEDIEENL